MVRESIVGQLGLLVNVISDSGVGVPFPFFLVLGRFPTRNAEQTRGEIRQKQ